MLREKRIVKRILAVFLIVAMLLPYTTDVFAAVLTHISGETAMIMSLMPHEGGEDSGLIPSQYISNYDNSVYSYQVATSGSEGRVQVFKMVQSGDYEYKDTLYCLNAKKEFPSESAHKYTNVGELKTTSNNIVVTEVV